MSNLIQGYKVVTAEEMVRIEKLAYAKGDSELAFMENAGMGIAEEAEEFCFANDLGKEVILLVGKGNNGGDAFAAGKRLLAKGFSVRAIQIYPFEISSPLCQKQGEAFKKAGGKIHFVKESAPFPELHEGVILDGLVGTGFRGKPDAPLARAIQKANQSHLPILAIDIPSGVNGNTGEVQTCAIHALRTIYLGLPKAGFFIGEGWNHVGELTRVDFGLKESYIHGAKAEAYLINEESVPALLPPVVRNRHKYQAGYVLAVAGSPGMSGAAFLATLAALRSGAGIVRLFHSASFRAELARAPLELVKEELKGSSLARIFEESKRAKSLLIGPGMGRTPDSKKKIKELLEKSALPALIDADALYFLAENPKWKIPKSSVLTPHRKEMERLLVQSKKEKDERAFHKECQRFAEKRKATLVLKGGPTFIFHPDEAPIIVTRGDPGMATAGTGDVLSGVIAALLAQGLQPRLAASIGALLHGAAGELAAIEKTSYGMIASDLIKLLPGAFSHYLI